MRAGAKSLPLAALSALLLLPVGLNGQYIVYDSYASYNMSTYTVQGYSYTWDIYGSVGVAVEATLLGPNLNQLDYDVDTEYYYWQAEAFVSYTLLSYWEFNNWYQCRGQHWYYDPYWGWQWYSYSQDYVYATQAPSPYDEISFPYGSMYRSGQWLVAAFYADLYPPSQLYNGAWVSESLTGFWDECYLQYPYGTLVMPEEWGWQVQNSSYGQDHVGSDYDSAEFYTWMIREGFISPCSWSATQSLRFGASPGTGTVYKTQWINMYVDGAVAASSRGNAYAQYWMP